MKSIKFSHLLISLLILVLIPTGIHAQTVKQGLADVKKAQNTFLQTDMDERITKIVNTPDFVRAANVSLNAISLSNSLTDYLSDVSTLNNPTNGDLGFSLSQKVESMLEDDIFKDTKKKGGLARLIEVVKSIIENPLVSSLTSAIPIVNSLGSVMNLVNNMAVENPDVPVENVNKFRADLSKYVQHYQGLADATTKFQGNVYGVQERTEELQIKLKSFTTQRIENLFPGQSEAASKETSLRIVLLEVYQKERVVKTLETVMAKYKLEGDVSLEKALIDPQLVYPEYVVNEARFLLDELVAISQDYVVSFNDYQHELELVLGKSKEFGDSEKIDQKIALMRVKLSKVEASFLDAVQVEEVEARFKALARTVGG